MMIRVMLVEDQVLLRDGLRALLHETSNLEIVAETGRGAEALALARRVHPDVVLLDIRLEKSSGIDVARVLRRELPETKVLVLSAYNHDAYVHALFDIGVHGYLLKSISGATLIEAVRAVRRGEQVFGAEVAAQFTALHHARVAAAWALSTREREVLTLVSHGESNKEIGRDLRLKESTVEAYLRSIMRKLGARSRTEAIRVAVQRGIIALED